MLNEKDFAIIRAALQFLDEEFTLGDDNLLTHYLDDRGVLTGANVTDIKATRLKLNDARAYLRLKRAGELELVSTEIFSLNADVTYQADKAVPVSIIDAGV